MKTTLIFCEGTHDVWFLYKLLLTNEQIEPYAKKLKEYPTPLPSFLRARMQDLRFGEKQVRELGRSDPPLLSAAATNGTRLWLFFDCTREDLGQVRKFMENFAQACSATGPVGGGLQSVRPGSETVESDFTVLYCCDADYLSMQGVPEPGGRANKLARIRDGMRGFAGVEDLASLAMGQWHRWSWQRDGLTERWSFGCLIFCAPDADEGTLEDLVLPVLERHQHFPLLAATKFIDDTLPTLDCPLKRAQSPAKRKKALINAAGQFFAPGYSMAVVFKNNKSNDDVLPATNLSDDAACRSLVPFLIGEKDLEW